jgi:acyl carrier protein
VDSSKLTVNKIIEDIRDIVSDQSDVHLEEIQPDSSLGFDLFFHDDAWDEMLLDFENQFNIEVSYEWGQELISARTFENLIDTFFGFLPRSLLNKIQSKIICFRVKQDGKIETTLRAEDGSWCYANGLSILPSNICLLTFSKWGNVLKDLDDLINSPRTKEQDLQKFFEIYPELLAGDDYDVILPQAVIVNDEQQTWRSDFVLAPKNQYEFAKILELKMPGLEITNRSKSRHFSFSAKIWHALQQVRDYSRAFDNKNIRHRFKNAYGVDIFKPDLHLIAGRKWDIKIMDSMRELQRETPVKIEDWDTALERLKRKYT